MRKVRPRPQQEPAPAPPVEAPRQPAAAGGAVQVIWGPMAESFELAEMTVGDAYRMLRGPFHIAPAVTALVNGRTVGEDERLAAGDVLEFARPAGEKGGTPH